MSEEIEPINELEARLHQILGFDQCPDCSRVLTRIDTYWNNGSTEAGTGYSVLHVLCSACNCDVKCVHSWYPSIESFEEFLDVLESEI